MKTIGWALVLLIGLMSAGCANVQDVPVKCDATETGIRYYQTSYYLLVNSDGKGGIQWRVMPLPDTSSMMAARPTNVIATLDTTRTFKNGVLTEATDVADSGTIYSAVISAAAKFASSLVAAEGVMSTTYPLPRPYFYKAVIHGSDVTFVGGQAEGDEIQVTVKNEEKGK